MPETAETVVDLTVLHQIGLQRFSKTVVRRILSTLRRMAADIEAQIRERLPTGENTEPDPASFRLASLLQQVRTTQAEAHRVIRGDLDADFGGVIATEAEFASRLSRISIGTDARLATVSAEQLRSAVMSRPFQGKALRDWALQLEAGDADRIRGQITMGYLEGESVPQVVRRVRQAGTVTARGAETLVRTSMTHINARAVEENAKANPDLFERYQWISILDNRTTPVCQGRAGKAYKHGSGPLPPAHPNCRSTIYSLVRGVPAADDLGYEGWLGRQDAATQRDILGPARYDLWKKGGVRIDRFTDGNRALTLDQLRARDAEAFRKAGL